MATPLSEPRPPAPRIGPGMTVWIDPAWRTPAIRRWARGRIGCCLSRPAGWAGCRRIARPAASGLHPFAAPHGDDPRAWAQFNAVHQPQRAGRGAGGRKPADCVFGRAWLCPPGCRAADAPADRPCASARAHHGSLAEPLSLGELAAVAGLSRYQLIRGFKHAYGQTRTPTSWISASTAPNACSSAASASPTWRSNWVLLIRAIFSGTSNNGWPPRPGIISNVCGGRGGHATPPVGPAAGANRRSVPAPSRPCPNRPRRAAPHLEIARSCKAHVFL